MKTELTLTAIETAACDFLEKHELSHGNAEYYTDFITLTVVVEAPNNWTISLEVNIEDIETVEELTEAIEHEYLRTIKRNSVDDYFDEMIGCGLSQFTPSEFFRMLEEDMDHFQSVVNKINGVEESIITGDLSTIIYNLEQMDFTAEDILYRLEEALKGYTFELDTENGDTITLKERN